MKKRKMMVLLMSVCLAAGSIGCGGQAPAAAPPSGEQQTAESTQTAGTETPAPDNLVRGGVGDGQYKESPLVHEQVEKGELPPIEERLPKEPAVVEVDEIGAYGGTYVGAAFGPSSGQVDTEGLRFQSLLTIEKDLKTFKPNLIQSYEINEDSTRFTIHLREGMKWSNGDDLTADDWMFWYTDILTNTDVNPSVEAAYCSNGKPMVYEQIDPYTLDIVFEEPNPAFEITMARYATNIIRTFLHPRNI